MGEATGIEWCDHTWNGWRGCAKISPGCANCYAEAGSHRNPAVLGGWGPKPRVIGAESYWRLPIAWDGRARRDGVRRRVFALSLGDWLEDHPGLALPRLRVLDLIRRTPNLDWLLVTKRPENFSRLVLEAIRKVPGSCGRHDELIMWATDWLIGRSPANVWAIASVENQEYADRRIAALLAIPAAIHGISAEPLLGPLDVSRWLVSPDGFTCPPVTGPLHVDDGAVGLDWVIAGGESGGDARPMHPDWARSIRDQCQEAGMAFYFKQWGEWGPVGTPGVHKRILMERDGRYQDYDPPPGIARHARDGLVTLYRVGKKAAGRTLDGREWSQFPGVAHAS